MLLASLGTCTAVVLHTYAQYHSVPLQEVVIDLVYDRMFGEDCEQCEGIDEYDERIKGTVALRGELTEDQRHRLHAVSRHCPIHKMLQTGIGVDVAFVDGGV
jgi:putative redox protein